jgi:hypothetical protein
MKTRSWNGREYHYWNVSDTSDLFIEIQPDGLIHIGDRGGDYNIITPQELKDLQRAVNEVVQFLQETLVTRKSQEI